MKIEKKSATKYIPIQNRKGWYPPIAEKVDLRVMGLDLVVFLRFRTVQITVLNCCLVQ